MNSLEYSLNRHVLLGSVAGLALIGGVGLWGATTNLSGAVVASGIVAIEGQVKKIQHPTGGVISSIQIKEGMHVRAGDILLKLDETTLNSNAQIHLKQIDESKMRIARLEAEQREDEHFQVPLEFLERMKESDIQIVFNNERALFASRMLAFTSQKAQINEKIHQSEEEIQGLTAVKASKQSELELIHRELSSVVELEKKGYALLSRLIALKRDAARMDGDVVNTTAELARARSRLLEAQTQLARLIQETQRDRSTEIRDTKSKLNESQERAISAKDALMRAEIRAPYSGIIHQLTANTVGGVVTANETILNIVPAHETLLIEAKIPQSDIDQIQLGEKVIVRFPAFNQRTTPELEGKLIHVSADISKDKEVTTQPNVAYYLGRIGLEKDQVARLNGATLVPGMVAETFIRTQERSALSYFLKPMSDQMARAFKER